MTVETCEKCGAELIRTSEAYAQCPNGHGGLFPAWRAGFEGFRPGISHNETVGPARRFKEALPRYKRAEKRLDGWKPTWDGEVDPDHPPVRYRLEGETMVAVNGESVTQEGDETMPRGKKTSEVQEPQIPAPETPPAPVQVSKTEAVKEALAEGLTSPLEISQWVRAKYGLEIDPNYVSNIKTTLTRKAGGEQSPKKGRAVPAGPVNPEGFISDIGTLKGLLERNGQGFAQVFKDRADLGLLKGLLDKYGVEGLGKLVEALA